MNIFDYIKISLSGCWKSFWTKMIHAKKLQQADTDVIELKEDKNGDSK